MATICRLVGGRETEMRLRFCNAKSVWVALFAGVVEGARTQIMAFRCRAVLGPSGQIVGGSQYPARGTPAESDRRAGPTVGASSSRATGAPVPGPRPELEVHHAHHHRLD